jgi:hypothetical protein
VGTDKQGNKYFEKKDAQWGGFSCRLLLPPALLPRRLAAQMQQGLQQHPLCHSRASVCDLLRPMRWAKQLLPHPNSHIPTNTASLSCPHPPPLAACPTVRNRFVVFAKADNFRTQDSSSVPPEWHGWLHYISDENPANVS